MSELKMVDLTFLFSFLFYFILILNLGLEFNMISYITVTNCHIM